ncbi:MAG: DUF748 domain-containing protein [Proteobacteria bacterium]|nr:DUF748 domain-containing protein [Pseudomonadota bacterium]
MPDRFGKITIYPTVPATPAGKEVKKTIPSPPSKVPKGKKRPSPRRKSSSLIWLGTVLVIFGLYNVIGFLGVPYYLTSTLSDNFNKSTGMVFDPGHISFNPFTFHLATEQAKILTETGTTLATLRFLSADLAPFSLLRLDLVCNTVTLSDLTLNITREEDGSYNFSKLLGQQQAGGPSEILNFSDLPFLFSLNNIAIKNGNVVFLDSPTGKTHTIEKIHLDLPTFSNIPFQTTQYLRPSFSAVINGSPVELTGQANMGGAADAATTLTCNLHSLDLPVYAEYLPLFLPLLVTSGKADGTINLLFDPASQEDDKIAIDFDLQLTDTELQTVDETVFVTAPETQVKGKLKPMAKSVVFSSISTTEPIFQSIGNSFLSSVNTLFKKEKKVSPTDKASSAPFSLAIDDLLVKDGTFHLWKEKQAKHPESSWNSLQVNVKNYSSIPPAESKKGSGSFILNGKKEGDSSSFTWQGPLPSIENLSGIVTIEKTDFKELLLSIGADQELAVKGLAELKGQLSVTFPQDSNASVGYKLADAELIVQDFQLLDDKLTVLSAPSVRITSLGTAYKTIHFGSVSLQNASLFLPVNRIPDIFKQFTVGKYLLKNIDFSGQISLLSGKKSNQKTLYSGVLLKANDLDTPEKTKDNFSISAQSSSGGVIQGNGDVRIAPFSLTINTEFKGLGAADIFPMMTHSSLLNSLTGVLAGKGSLSLPKRRFAGELQLTKAVIRNGPGSSFSWDDMLLQGVNFTAEPFHLGITSTTINQPQFSWKISKNDPGLMPQLASFFQRHLPTSENEIQSADKTKVAISPVNIQEIQFNQGNILIQDNRLKPKWKGDVTDLSGTIKDIHLTASASNSVFSFTGKLQDAPFTIVGAMDVFAKEHNGKFRYTLDSYPLASFHEQLAPLTDINTKNGFFDLQLDFTSKDGQFQNTGSLLFSNVKPISEKSESALTLALLTGPDDTFRLDFDFARTAPLGKTIFLKEILSFFQTKVVKASVSPLLLASGDFTDLIGNEFAEFEPGKYTLSERGKEVLSRYASLLTSHPQLGMELSGGIDRNIDTPAMVKLLEAAEIQRVEDENKKRFEAWQKEKALFDQKVIERQTKLAAQRKNVENTLPPAVLKDYIPVQPKQLIVDDVMLLELAKKRGQVLSQYLAEQQVVEPGRLVIVPLKRITSDQSGLPASVMKITLIAIK